MAVERPEPTDDARLAMASEAAGRGGTLLQQILAVVRKAERPARESAVRPYEITPKPATGDTKVDEAAADLWKKMQKFSPTRSLFYPPL